MILVEHSYSYRHKDGSLRVIREECLFKNYVGVQHSLYIPVPPHNYKFLIKRGSVFKRDFSFGYEDPE